MELNEKLEIQKVAVTEKTEACEKLLEEITQKTSQANEKRELAVGKRTEIAEEKIKIASEKVRYSEWYMLSQLVFRSHQEKYY